jgi:chaperonin cofactor prefoldin
MSAHVERVVPMPKRSPRPSPRFLRAVAAEQSDLARRRDELLEQRRLLQAQLDEIDATVGEVDERLLLIHRLIGEDPEQQGEITGAASPVTTTQHAGCDEPLRGPAIRVTAIRVLLGHPRRPEAIHYREWFSLVADAGYRVAGKDPLAVFLTQLSRSPLVHRGTQSGVYELDRDAPDRLRRNLEALKSQLRAMTAAPSSSTASLSSIRSQRTALNLEIGKLEKALEEAQETLKPTTAGQDLAAAG